MLRQEIQDQMKQAMKNRDQVRLGALRFLWSEIKNAEIDAKVELDDSGIHAIIKKEVKKRSQAIDQMKEAGREELAMEEEAKLAVISEFMMEEMSEEKISALVDQAVDEGLTEFGKVMGHVMGLAQGQADGRLVQKIVREKLS